MFFENIDPCGRGIISRMGRQTTRGLFLAGQRSEAINRMRPYLARSNIRRCSQKEWSQEHKRLPSLRMLQRAFPHECEAIAVAPGPHQAKWKLRRAFVRSSERRWFRRK